MLNYSGEQYGNKGAGRSCDLETGTAEQGHGETSDDRSPQTLLWRDPGGNAETNRERQRDDADCDAGSQITQEIVARVITKSGKDCRSKSGHRGLGLIWAAGDPNHRGNAAVDVGVSNFIEQPQCFCGIAFLIRQRLIKPA